MLKKLLLVALSFYSFSIFGQCPTSVITLRSQADVDAFFTTYPGCTELQNTLVISGSDITDLSPLNGIVSANGPSIDGLDISGNTLLTNLDGLESLEAVGNLFITNNPLLENLNGLSGLLTIEDGSFQTTLSIQSNPALTSIAGLEEATFAADEELIIRNNISLSTCNNDLICSFLADADISFLVSIENNAPGCDTREEVEAACPTCPTGDVILTSQAEIDSFFTTYPGCTNFSFDLSIGGPDIVDLTPLNGLESVRSLFIANNILLTNLDGLETLTTISPTGFGLVIQDNNNLEDISGLSGVTGVIGNILVVNTNPALLSLNGLQNITQPVDDDVIIINNDALTDLQGLNGITTTDDMLILDNDGLLSLEGLSNFSFTGTLEIGRNGLLQNVNGLTSLSTIFGLSIYDNPQLSDISGLNSGAFDEFALGLSITNNPNLDTCNAALICDYLAVAPALDVTIENNAPGCDSREEVEASCAVCPTISEFLTTQAQIDAFAETYPFCTTIDVSIVVRGDDITDLSGLGQIEVLKGVLRVDNNPLLENFDGLNPIFLDRGGILIERNPLLSSISEFSGTADRGVLFSRNAVLSSISSVSGITSAESINVFDHPELTSLDGLQNITVCDVSLVIVDNPLIPDLLPLSGLTGGVGTIRIKNNDLLTDLSGLEGITDITGSISSFDGLNISDNNSLESLNGLQNLTNAVLEPLWPVIINNNASLVDISALNNLNPGTVNELEIQLNPLLEVCNNDFICEYLAGSGSSAVIENNAPGCDSREEVEDSCSVCPTGEITLSSQAEVDAFAATYPLCDTFDFQITITGADITNLSGLSQIETLRGGLEIRNNPNLTSLAGLGPVFLDNSSLWVEDNPVLSDLGEFSGTAGFPGFIIVNNDQLVNLNGLEGITSSFDLFVEENDALLSLDGLQNLAVIEDLISIRLNSVLTEITALSGFSGTLNSIQISQNASLVDFQGLEGLTAVEDGMTIQNNNSLVSLQGLENCVNATIETLYGITIRNNLNLTDISALDGYNVNAVGVIRFTSNANLSVCNNEFVCNFLNRLDPPPSATISGNAPGCDSEEEVISACTICITSDVTLNSQAEVDAFRNDFRFCDTVDGVRLTISGPDITDLSALSQLTNFVDNGTLWIENNPNLTTLASLGPLTFDDAGLVVSNNASLESLGEFSGNTDEFGLTIFGNASLTDISGLSGITSTKELRIIGQNSLTNLEGLENLTTVIELIDISDNPVLADLTDLTGINGDYWELLIDNNDSLTDLSGLEGLSGLTSIELSITDNDNLVSFNGLQNFFNENGGGLSFDISDNASLTDISAINGLDADTVDVLIIQNNPLLAVCENDFVCTYLDTSVTIGVLISDNAPGCNTVEEVEEACGLSVDEFSIESVKLYPNPAMDLVTLDLPTGLELREVVILNLLGQQVVSSNEQSFDVSGLEAGVYFVQVETNAGTVLKRLIKR